LLCCACIIDDVNVLYSRSPIARQDKTALAFPSTQLKIEMRRTHKNDDAREFIESIV
jgi:hypothetical protein